MSPILSRPKARVLAAAGFFAAAALAVKASSPQSHDFPLAVYYPVRAVLDGGSPYDRTFFFAHYPVQHPFAPYPPSSLLLHLPFGLFPAAVSDGLYLAFMLALTLVLAHISLRYNGLKLPISATLVLAGLILLSRPGRMNLVLGNVTLQIVLAIYVAIHYARSKPWLSGLGLAVALVKPSFGGPLALLMLGMGAGRPILRGAVLTALLNLPVAAILSYRAGGIPEFLQSLTGALEDYQTRARFNNPLESPSRIDAVSLISRFTGESLGTGGQLLVAALAVGSGIWALRAVGRWDGPRPTGMMVGLAGGVILLCGYHQPYDFLVLTLPFVAAAYRCYPPSLNRHPANAVLLLLFAIPALNYFSTFRMLDRLGVTSGYTGLDLALLSRNPLIILFVSLNALALLLVYVMHVVGARAPLTAGVRRSDGTVG